MKRTLLTGFGPFGIIASNPSQRVVEHFRDAGAPGHELTTHVFPVSYAAVARELEDLLGEVGEQRFDAVRMLGVNGGADHWRVEQYGTNRDGAGSVDMDGAGGGSEIIPGMPDRLTCTLNVDRLKDALTAAAIPAKVSDSAGGYLCNHLLYRALARLRGGPAVAAGFIHIPPDPFTFEVEYPEAKNARSLSQHIRAVEVLLEELTWTRYRL